MVSGCDVWPMHGVASNKTPQAQRSGPYPQRREHIRSRHLATSAIVSITYKEHKDV